MLFCKTIMRSFDSINALLDNLALNTGLAMNKEKSKVFLSKDCKDKDKLAELINIPVDSFPAKYLGLPLSQNYLKAKDCIPLVDKFRRYVEGWMAKLLSFSGRAELIKTVLSNVLGYWL